MKPELWMFWSVLTFGLFGAYTASLQIRMIWSSKSAHSVSGAAVIVAVAFFSAFGVYGIIVGNILTGSHGAWRAFFWAAVAIGFVRYGRPTLWHLCLAIVCLTMLVCMNSDSLRNPILFTMTCMSICVAWVQAYAIVANKARGRVSIWNQIVPMTSATTWVAYGFAIGDTTLGCTSLLNVVSYFGIIGAWIKYPNPPPQLQPTT